MVRKNRSARSAYVVGGKVYLQFGGRKRVARVLEDRGLIGYGGRRLLRVQFLAEGDPEPDIVEIPETEVTPFVATRSRK